MSKLIQITDFKLCLQIPVWKWKSYDPHWIVAFSFFYANSQINVGNITTYDIGNDINIKGGVINTNRAQGKIGDNVNIESLQDTYSYDSDQKNMGFSADIDLKGAGSSLSVNGGKTHITADYKAVGQQWGFYANEADLIVEGKGNFKGAVFTTSEEAQATSKSNIVFEQIET